MDGKEECICWPQMWIPKDLNDNVKILSLSYDSHVVASVHNDVTEIGRNLIQSLVTDSRYEIFWDGPVAMVAYSFGGLDPTQSCLLKNMESFNQKMEQLSKDFNNSICKDINILHLLKDYLLMTNGFPFFVHKSIIALPWASATRFSNNNNYKVEDANHLTICKPPSQDHLSYSKLLECLKIFMKEKNTPTMPRLPRYEVALEDKANAIYSLLQNESIVALVGMGGIGKTTLSTKVYHLFHNQYEKSSFLEDVKSKHINNVKKKLL
ncbi:unnamed protein product [Sphagnum tenellum]